MDVNWYALEVLAHQRIAEIRAAAARRSMVAGWPEPRLNAVMPGAVARMRRRLLRALEGTGVRPRHRCRTVTPGPDGIR